MTQVTAMFPGVTAYRWTLRLEAEFGHADITPLLMELVSESGLRNGVLTVQMLGSTGAITTIEYEFGALSDLRNALETLAQDQPVASHRRSRARTGHLAAGGGDQPRYRERARELVAVVVGSL